MLRTMEVSDIFRYKKSQTDVENYLRWLCDDVELDYDKYRNVASTMLFFEFDDSLKNDINRTYDAVENRRYFEDEYGIMLDFYDLDRCGILEMLVVLARRAADIMYDAHEEDQTPAYFWLMFKNLGLDKFDDAHYDNGKVMQILNKFNDRKYDEHGKGGLFYISVPPDNIKRAEIWSQLNWYLTEKYFKNGQK